jgi:3-phosphoglycerate kinase
MEHRLAGLDQGGKVKDAVKGPSLGFGRGKKAFKSGPVGQLTFDKFHAGGQKVASSMAQVVKNHDLIPIFGQQSGDCAANVPRTASNQYSHKKLPPFPRNSV